MRVICAWCKKIIKEGSTENGISHGICVECKKGCDKEIEEIRKYNEGERIGRRKSNETKTVTRHA